MLKSNITFPIDIDIPRFNTVEEEPSLDEYMIDEEDGIDCLDCLLRYHPIDYILSQLAHSKAVLTMDRYRLLIVIMEESIHIVDEELYHILDSIELLVDILSRVENKTPEFKANNLNIIRRLKDYRDMINKHGLEYIELLTPVSRL